MGGGYAALENSPDLIRRRFAETTAGQGNTAPTVSTANDQLPTPFSGPGFYQDHWRWQHHFAPDLPIWKRRLQ